MLARTHLVSRFVQLAIFTLVLMLGLSGCASMVSSKEELQSFGEDEGIVIGSFVINVEKGEEKESGWAFIKGYKAGDSDYRVEILEKPVSDSYIGKELSNLNMFKTTYTFDVKPEQEFTFIKKLKAGTYQVRKIQKQGFGNLFVNLAVDLTVKSQQTTYVGRLTVQFPNRIRGGSAVETKVTNAQEETINSLKKEHGDSLFINVVTELMR